MQQTGSSISEELQTVEGGRRGRRQRRRQRLIIERQQKASKDQPSSEITANALPPPVHLLNTPALEPPAGLSRRGRKRWRNRLARKAAKATQRSDGNVAKTMIHSVTQPERSSPLQEHGQTGRRDALLHSAATTRSLMPQGRQWDRGPESLESLVRHGRSDWVLVEGSEVDGARSTQAVSTPSPMQVGEPRSEAPASSFGGGISIDCYDGRLKGSDAIASKIATKRSNQQIVCTPTSLITALPFQIGPAISMRRTSFVSKPISVPLHASSIDPRAVFQRFDAFLQGGTKSHSQSESDEDSDQESDDQSRHGGTGSTALPMPVDCLPNIITSNNSDSDDNVNTIRQPNKPSMAINPYAAINGSDRPDGIAWPANVGIKRHIAFGCCEANKSDLGPNFAHDRAIDGTQISRLLSPQPPKPFHDGAGYETEDDVMQAVNDISQAVFESTRKLSQLLSPACSDAHKRARGNPTHLASSGNRRSTRNTLNRGGDLDLRGPLLTIPLPQRMHVICNTVQISESVHDAAGDSQNPRLSPRVGHTLKDELPRRTLQRDTHSNSSTSLSELSRTPSPPSELVSVGASSGQVAGKIIALGAGSNSVEDEIALSKPSSPGMKRRMTGRTSRHFTPEKPAKRTRSLPDGKNDKTPDATKEANSGLGDKVVLQPKRISLRLRSTSADIADSEQEMPTIDSPSPQADSNSVETPPSTRTRAKSRTTGTKSAYFTPPRPSPAYLDSPHLDRVDLYNSTAGDRKDGSTSKRPVPSIRAERFGIIQEKLWREPFWLLVAVTFLNKTAGRAAAPIFWQLKEKYPTAEELAAADVGELCNMIYCLGLQTQRSKRLVTMAQAWVERPPAKGVRFRTLHYPCKGDGKGFRGDEAVDEDADEISGALEIGHIPGCGPYAWDSWRMFCRDTLRGVADDYMGLNAPPADFTPEWQRVLPLDKELRACLRWMWLREGWIWNHETGEKREATAEEMKMAVLGDPGVFAEEERKFAQRAQAQVDAEPDSEIQTKNIDVPTSTAEHEKTTSKSILQTPEQQPGVGRDDDDDDDDISE